MKPLNLLTWLFLGLIAISVLASVFFVFKTEVSAQTPKEVCKQSVKIAALSNKIFGVDRSEEINCPTQYEEIKIRDEEAIKKKLASKMYDCWWQFWAGQEELFNTPKIYCVICSVTSFENKDRKIRGFSKYLMETEIPGKRIKYIDYFSGFETSKADEVVGEIEPEVLAGLENEELDTSKKYAVLFVYAKGKDNMEKIANHLFMKTPEGKLGAIASGIFGPIAGIGAGLGVIGSLGMVSNPVGWAIGIGVGTAALTVVGIELISYHFSSDNAPEWAAFVVFREYTAENIQELGCMELPVKQK